MGIVTALLAVRGILHLREQQLEEEAVESRPGITGMPGPLTSEEIRAWASRDTSDYERLEDEYYADLARLEEAERRG